jgi:hypothetical protein
LPTISRRSISHQGSQPGRYCCAVDIFKERDGVKKTIKTESSEEVFDINVKSETEKFHEEPQRRHRVAQREISNLRKPILHTP